MPDALRTVLFSLSLGAVLGTSLIGAGALRLGGTGSLLATWVLATGQIILLAELLSLFHWLDWPGFLVGHLLTAGGVALWSWRRPAGCRWHALRQLKAGLGNTAAVALDWRYPWLPILAAATLAVAGIGAVLALWVPPNSIDSLAYHMPRVGYYLQFRSLDHFPTDDHRQVTLPADAEILILWTVAFLRSDRLANLVQFAAWGVTAAAVYGLGRLIGLERRAALFGAGAFALLPQSVLQSTATLNDLVVASFVVVALYFLLRATEAPRPIADLALAGAAIGLALGTKPTTLLAVPGLAVAFLVVCWRRARFRWSGSRPCHPWNARDIAAGVLLGGAVAVAFGAYFYVQNWLLYGSPFGRAADAAPPASVWPALAANLARISYRFALADLTGPLADPRLQPVAAALQHGIAWVGERFFGAFGIPITLPGIDFDFRPRFSFLLRPRVHELFSGIGWIGASSLVVAAAVLAWPRRTPAERRLVALAALSYLVAMALLLRWNPYGYGRFLLTAAALAAPLLGLVVSRPARWTQALALALAAWSAAAGLYVALFNEHKAVTRLAGRDRLELMLPHLPEQVIVFRALEAQLGPDATVAVYGERLRNTGRRYQGEYLFFGERFGRTVLPLVAPNYPQREGLRRPPSWSNESLIASSRPGYVVVGSRFGRVGALPGVAPGQCLELPMPSQPRVSRWELWRCQGQDPVGGGKSR